MQKEDVFLQQVSSKPKKKVKKLVSVLVTSTPVSATRMKAVETTEAIEAIETIGASENGKESKSGDYPENFARVPYI